MSPKASNTLHKVLHTPESMVHWYLISVAEEVVDMRGGWADPDLLVW